MAKPIRSTPKLSGNDASDFIRKMICLGVALILAFKSQEGKISIPLMNFSK